MNLTSSPPASQQPAISLKRITHVMTEDWFQLAMIIAVLLLIVIQQGIWQFPLGRDPSSHIYVGQRVMAGDLPYRDFIQFQPPGRLAISVLWAAVAKFSGINIVHVQRFYGLLVVITLLIMIARMTRKLTDSSVAGNLAALVILGLDGITICVVEGHALRLTLALLFVLVAWLLQTRRWFLAGLAGGAAVSIWLPAGVLLLASAAIVLMQREGERWQGLGRCLLGFSMAPLVVLLLLALSGLLNDAFIQTFRGTFLYLDRQVSAPAQGGDWAVFNERLQKNVMTTINEYLLGESLLLLALLAIPVLLVRHGWDTLRLPRLAAPLVVPGMLTLFIYSLDRLGSKDIVLLLPFLAGVVACAILLLAEAINKSVPHLSTGVISALLGGIVLLYGMADVNTRYETKGVSLQTQQCMADALTAALRSEQYVQSLDNLWYPVLSSQPNATRYGWLGPKVVTAVRAQGLEMEDVQAELEAVQPAVIIVNLESSSGYFTDYPDKQYLRVGKMMGGALSIYVREDEEAIQSVVSAWFAENKNKPECSSNQS
jgi:hypothetical protein